MGQDMLTTLPKRPACMPPLCRQQSNDAADTKHASSEILKGLRCLTTGNTSFIYMIYQ